MQNPSHYHYKSAMKTLPFILMALAMLALASCSGTTVALGGEALGIWSTRPDQLPPADTADQIAQHESWCYNTMGYPECYTTPQDGAGNRLINVDPESRYPLTPRAYNEAVVESH
jgi:hypothetical protein